MMVKKSHLILFVLFFLSLTINASEQPVNSLIGDNGFIAIKGHVPTSYDSEKERVQCHLLYVEYLLRQKDVSNLTADKKRKRKAALNYLHQYAIAGIYPSNFDFKDQRKPCFIDEEGNICAVGYLVQETTNREMAESINELFKYAAIYEMDLEIIQNWAEENGLTVEECAMIQPTYGWIPHFERNRRLIFSLGTSYRLKQELYSSFDIAYIFKIRKFGSRNNLLGIRYTPLRNQNHSLLFNYGRDIYTRKRMRTFASVGGEYFNVDSRTGWNLAPELGIAWQYVKERIVFDAKLSYSYHIGLTGKTFYQPNRNEVLGLIGIGFTL